MLSTIFVLRMTCSVLKVTKNGHQKLKLKCVSLRTFNRNFEGRSGTADANVYLCSPETAVAAAITGEITNPMLLGEMPEIKIRESRQRFRADIIVQRDGEKVTLKDVDFFTYLPSKDSEPALATDFYLEFKDKTFFILSPTLRL